MSVINAFPSPLLIAPSPITLSTSWNTYDLSDIPDVPIPSSATGLIITSHRPVAGSTGFLEIRKTGSGDVGDTVKFNSNIFNSKTNYVGLDSNNSFDMRKTESGGNFNVYVNGWFDDGAVFLDGATGLAASDEPTFSTHDLTTELSPDDGNVEAVILSYVLSSVAKNSPIIGCRHPDASTAAFTCDVGYGVYHHICKINDSNEVELTKDKDDGDWKLIGYIKRGYGLNMFVSPNLNEITTSYVETNAIKDIRGATGIVEPNPVTLIYTRELGSFTVNSRVTSIGYRQPTLTQPQGQHYTGIVRLTNAKFLATSSGPTDPGDIRVWGYCVEDPKHLSLLGVGN